MCAAWDMGGRCCQNRYYIADNDGIAAVLLLWDRCWIAVWHEDMLQGGWKCTQRFWQLHPWIWRHWSNFHGDVSIALLIMGVNVWRLALGAELGSQHISDAALISLCCSPSGIFRTCKSYWKVYLDTGGCIFWKWDEVIFWTLWQRKQ